MIYLLYSLQATPFIADTVGTLTSSARVRNGGLLFQPNVCKLFSLGFSCCPYHRVVRYNGVSARRELTVQGE